MVSVELRSTLRCSASHHSLSSNKRSSSSAIRIVSRNDCGEQGFGLMTHENELLDSFARRLQQQTDFMAYILHIYLEQEHIGEDQLAAQLGIDGGSLNRLRTCRTPRAGPEHFGADVQHIAQFTGADITTLAR